MPVDSERPHPQGPWGSPGGGVVETQLVLCFATARCDHRKSKGVCDEPLPAGAKRQSIFPLLAPSHEKTARPAPNSTARPPSAASHQAMMALVVSSKLAPSRVVPSCPRGRCLRRNRPPVTAVATPRMPGNGEEVQDKFQLMCFLHKTAPLLVQIGPLAFGRGVCA